MHWSMRGADARHGVELAKSETSGHADSTVCCSVLTRMGPYLRAGTQLYCALPTRWITQLSSRRQRNTQSATLPLTWGWYWSNRANVVKITPEGLYYRLAPSIAGARIA